MRVQVGPAEHEGLEWDGYGREILHPWKEKGGVVKRATVVWIVLKTGMDAQASVETHIQLGGGDDWILQDV